MLWPTPTATPYGTQNNGNPHDGREAYATAGKPSLETMMARTGGALSADWVECLMGFPRGWTSGLRESDGTLTLWSQLGPCEPG